MDTIKITEQQQQTIAGILARMRADDWGDGGLDIVALADEAAEFGTFDEDEVERAGEGAVVVLRDFDLDAGVECEVPDRGLAIARDGRIIV